MKRDDAAIRKPPVAEVFALHLPRVAGKCPWCGETVGEIAASGSRRRAMHVACVAELGVITSPLRARAAVLERDGGVCFDCGEDWRDRYRVVRGQEQSDHTPVTFVSLWHVDHKTPLWKVAHMEPAKRIEYFKLANLATRCTPCHQHKTKWEAHESAHYRNVTGESKAKPKPKFKWPKGRKLQSRGFRRGQSSLKRSPK